MLKGLLNLHAEYLDLFVGLFQYHKESYGSVSDEEET